MQFDLFGQPDAVDKPAPKPTTTYSYSISGGNVAVTDKQHNRHTFKPRGKTPQDLNDIKLLLKAALIRNKEHRFYNFLSEFMSDAEMNNEYKNWSH